MPAVSPPPEGATTDFPFFFFEICFSLWFRSDALSVSPEPELQIHSVFQGFLFLFSNVQFFSMESFFFKVRKKVYLFGVYAGDIHLHISIYLSIHPSIYIHVLVHRTLNIVISMRDNDNMSNDESAISFLRSLAPQRFRQLLQHTRFESCIVT